MDNLVERFEIESRVGQLVKNWEKNRFNIGKPKDVKGIFHMVDVENNCTFTNNDNLSLEELLKLEEEGKILIFT